MSDKISAIIPAFNEEKRIRTVLTTLKKCQNISEIICVNDGSKDNTAAIARSIPGVIVVDLKKNYGKSYAISQGVSLAKGDIILFIDADLTGLKEAYINELLSPLSQKQYDASIGYRAGALDKYMFMPLSGERAYFKKDILPHLPKMQDKGYGLELYLNYAFKDKRVKLLALKGVRHALKHKKQGYKVATKGMMDEISDLFMEVFSKKDPINFFINAYMYPFYVKKKPRMTLQAKKKLA